MRKRMLFGVSKRRLVLTAALIIILGWFISDRLGIMELLFPRKDVPTVSASRHGPLPLQEFVFSLVRPLEYSGLEALWGPDVTLRVDFSQRTWTLKNFRQYDEKGELLLAGGRFGLCAELTAYVFQKLRPVLGERYLLEFAWVSEPEFFGTLESRHIILTITDPVNREAFMLDPSFHRYGRPGVFPRYVFYEARDTLATIRDRERDVTFKIGETMPLVIRSGVLVVFSVDPANGVLDPKNISLTVSALGRRSPSGRHLFAVYKESGKVDVLRREAMPASLLTDHEQTHLVQKMISWMLALDAAKS